MTHEDALAWRRSSFSGGGDNGGAECIEAAGLVSGRIAIRDSKNPAAGAAVFGRAALATWIKGVKSGEFRDLA